MFSHRSLELKKKKKLVYIGMSKHMFYFGKHAVKFVLERGFVPISPYGTFDYFLLDTVNRDLVREANNNLLMVSDEFWVFGPISDGVLAEIQLAKELGKPVRYFKVINSKEIQEVSPGEVEFEPGLEKYKELL